VLWTFGRNDPHLIEISGEEAVDVDTMDEFEVAEVVYKRERELRG
jgi:CMP-N-acetylneuraminic acid synthetase